jgi:hypothetical protein
MKNKNYRLLKITIENTIKEFQEPFKNTIT